METGIASKNLLSSLARFPGRFFALYFFIYIFPFPVGYLPLTHTLNGWYHSVLDALILWMGRHLFHVPFAVVPNNSTGTDTTYDYIQVALFIIVALAGVAVWYAAERRHRYRISVLFWITLYVRYRFAFSMIKYGLVKIIKVQFLFPYYSLNETYGESSPMRLLWSFMGYSTAYNVFIGCAELAAGALLVFRRTALAGALLSIAILSNVVMLNFCYDVSVKVHSVNLLLMAVFLVTPYTGQLKEVVFSGKASVSPAFLSSRLKPRFRSAWFFIKYTLVIYLTYSAVVQIWKLSFTSGDNAFTRTPLFGVYDVERFTTTATPLPLNQADTAQWKSLTIYLPKRATVKMITDSIRTYHFITDTLNKQVRFYEEPDSAHKNILSYSVLDSDHLMMSGRLGTDSVYMLLRKHDLEKYRLINRGFHWIDESNYNK